MIRRESGAVSKSSMLTPLAVGFFANGMAGPMCELFTQILRV